MNKLLAISIASVSIAIGAFPVIGKAHEGGTVWFLIRSTFSQGGNALEKIPFPTLEQCEKARTLIDSKREDFAHWHDRDRYFGTMCIDTRVQD